MSNQRRGRRVPIGLGRRLVLELMRQSRAVPLVTVRKEFSIPALVELRQEASDRVSWVALFAKAYALAAVKHDHLRRQFLTFPYGRIYEHPISECLVLVERDWQGEEAVLGAKVRGPENLPLGQLDGYIRSFHSMPVWSQAGFRQQLRLARLPWPLRQLCFSAALNWSGPRRCRRFGTFMISSLGNFGSETLAPHQPLTGYLTYGPIADDGRVAVCLAFDHRVMDGRHAARALADMEQIMTTALALELRALAAARPASATSPADGRMAATV